MRKNGSGASKPKPKKKNRLIRVVAVFLGLIIGIFGFLLWYKHHLFSKIAMPTSDVTVLDENGNKIDFGKLNTDIRNDLPKFDEGVKNFLLIGVDSRTKELPKDGKALSDVIMVMSIDSKKGTMKLMSIARDSYAYVPGFESKPRKINAAMSLGGPDTLMATVMDTLQIDIDGYAYINFYNMIDVIDAVGGVTVNVTSDELTHQAGLNDNLASINKGEGLPADKDRVTQTGDVVLNGRQAVAYARIRHVDNDYYRSARQVEVLNSLMSSFMKLSKLDKANCLGTIIESELIKTNISEKDITKYALEIVPSLDNPEIQYLSLPLQHLEGLNDAQFTGSFFNGGNFGNEWSIRNNWNATIPYVQDYFYGERKEFERVQDIPNAPTDDQCPKDVKVEDFIQHK